MIEDNSAAPARDNTAFIILLFSVMGSIKEM
jgi:hypothetical protein